MARTRSEMRDVLLSISFSRVATSTEAAILTRAARAVSASRIANSDSSASGLTFLARQVGRQLPQVVLPVAAQQGIDLVFQVAHGQRIGRNFVALDEGSFQLLDFRFLRRGEVAPSQFVAGVADFLQDVAQLAGGALGGGSGIVELMSEPRGKFSQGGQAVALLLEPSGFADSVGHQADEALGQFRHFLHKLGKQRGRKAQDAASVMARAPTVNCFIREKGSTPVTSPGLTGITMVSPPNSPRP